MELTTEALIGTELEWPGSYCNGNSNSPHFMVEVQHESGLSLFACKKCHTLEILPNSDLECSRLGDMFKKIGRNEGYRQFLNSRKDSAKLIALVKKVRIMEAEDESKAVK